MTRVCVIDHDRLTRQGVEREIEGSHPTVRLQKGMSFDEAFANSSWSELDLILIDLAESNRFRRTTSEPPDEHVGCQLVRHVRGYTRLLPRPAIVVVTGQDVSFDNDAVRLRLREDGADGFVHREELESLLPAILAEGRRFRREIVILDKEALHVRGLTDRTRMATFVDKYIRGEVDTMPTIGPGEERRSRIYDSLAATGVRTGQTRKKARFDQVFEFATRINPWKAPK